ncbi:PAS domain-containing protein [Halobaculum sp. MBLA0147]|uniref:PAS domain-containing sensor histidine kinase n=1 Tax=Halobaculum sp. MBLA0147 TaxID=3079934 RepID=UPI003524317D
MSEEFETETDTETEIGAEVETAVAARAAVERMTDGFIAVDSEWRVTYVNDRASHFLGADNTPGVGDDFWAAFPELRSSAFGRAYVEAMESGDPETAEAYYEPLDGWFEARAYPDEEGLSIFFRDVSDRRELEERLRRENELRERVFETAPTGILVMDATGTFQRGNDRARDLLGVCDETLTGLTYDDPGWETFGEDGEPVERYPVDEVLETDEAVHHVEHGLEREDGSRVWLSVSVAPLHDADGNVERLVAVIDDHTDQRRLQSRLRESHDSLRRLYEVAGDAELDFEEKLREILAVGRERLDLELGFLTQIGDDTQTIVEAVGDHHAIRSGNSCPLSQAYCKRTIDSEGLLAVYDAIEAGWPGTEPYEVFELGSYVGGKVVVDGELYGTLCFADGDPRGTAFTDAEQTFVELLTQWVSFELERHERIERIERKNDRLDEFASVVSHDLRNPLNVASARVDMAADSGDTSHLGDASDALDRMAALIDDMLSLARHGEEVVDAEPVELEDAATAAWGGLERASTGEATLEVAESVPTVRGDRDRVIQLFEKLFGNAVDHGGPDVTVTVGPLVDESAGDGESSSDESDPDAWCGFYVADDGPGVPADRRDEIFDHGFSTEESGTGFGLGIVAEIVEAHGWAVAVTEGRDGGARFEVEAPTFTVFEDA